ncbi:MAG: hypothetical protein ACOX6G_01090 [Christensenellales bacterium]
MLKDIGSNQVDSGLSLKVAAKSSAGQELSLAKSQKTVASQSVSLSGYFILNAQCYWASTLTTAQ